MSSRPIKVRVDRGWRWRPLFGWFEKQRRNWGLGAVVFTGMIPPWDNSLPPAALTSLFQLQRGRWDAGVDLFSTPITAHGNHISIMWSDDPMFWKALFMKGSVWHKRFLKRLTRYLQSWRPSGQKRLLIFLQPLAVGSMNFYLWIKSSLKTFMILWAGSRVKRMSKTIVKIPTKVILSSVNGSVKMMKLRSNRWRKSVKSRISLIENGFLAKFSIVL